MSTLKAVAIGIIVGGLATIALVVAAPTAGRSTAGASQALARAMRD